MEGYQVSQAENGAVALEQILNELPDLILCDIDMPIMSGLEVLRQVKANPTVKSIPFIIVSANTDPVILQQILDSGADAHTSKPMPIDKLLEMLSKFWG